MRLDTNSEQPGLVPVKNYQGLFPFQREGVDQIGRFNGRALLADEQGLGKTVQALYWLKQNPHLRPALIVCPASIKYTWKREAWYHAQIHAVLLEGRSGRVINEDVVISNYDILPYWEEWILKWAPRCVIIDEIQYIKNRKAQRSQSVHRITQQPSVVSVVGLSGTPLTDRPVELWSVLKAVRPDLFPSYSKFVWRYCAPRFTPWGWDFGGASNLEELRGILRQHCMIRRLKREVLTQLPPLRARYQFYQLNSVQRQEYEFAKTHFLEWLNRRDKARAMRAERAEALARVGYLLRLVSEIKLDWVIQWIRDFLATRPNQKLAVFTGRRFVVDALAHRFPCVVLDGRVSGKDRDFAVRHFQTGSSQRSRLLVGNYRVAGVGLTLTAAADLVMADLPWTPGDLAQARDRIHRIGQDKDVTIHFLVAENTVEEKLARLLHRKSNVIEAVLDGGGSGFVDLLQELIDVLQDSPSAR